METVNQSPSDGESKPNTETILSHSPNLKRYATYLFVMLFLLYMFDYIDRLVVTSLFPFLERDMGLNDAQSGALVSAVYWSIVVFTFPISILIDRWSRRRSIGLMVIVWSVATGLCALAGSFGALFAVRLAVGVGEAGYAPGGNALISAMYTPEKRSRMLGFWNASIPLGSAIGIVLGGLIATRWGWRHAFGIVALPGLLIGLLFFFTVKDYRTVRLQKRSATGTMRVKMSPRDIVTQFTRTPSLLFTYFGFAGNTFVTTALLTWLPTYFHRYQGLPISQASLKAAPVLLIAVVGAPLGGIIADAWMKRRVNARLLFAATTSVLSSALLFVAFAAASGAVQYIVLLAGGLTAVAYVSAASAVTEDVVHPGLWAISYSVAVVIQNLLGSSMGPVVVGALSDARGLSAALLVVPLFSFLAGVLFFIGSFFYPRDYAKVEKVRLELDR